MFYSHTLRSAQWLGIIPLVSTYMWVSGGRKCLFFGTFCVRTKWMIPYFFRINVSNPPQNSQQRNNFTKRSLKLTTYLTPISKILNRNKNRCESETYPKPSQTSNTELFAKRVTGFLTIFSLCKRFILDVWQSSEYACVRNTMKTYIFFIICG